jgi:hypothetical protein
MPDVEEQMSAVGRVVQGVGALLGLTPAIALLMGLVSIPPDLADLIKVLSFFISAGVILAIILMRASIRRMKSNVAAMLVLATVLLGSIAATGYWIVAQGHLIAVTNGKAIEYFVVPLHPSARIERAVAPFGRHFEEAIYVSRQKDDLRTWMREESGSASVVMLFLLVLANVLLVSGVVGGAWKVAGTIRGKAPPPKTPDAAKVGGAASP